MYVCMYVFMHTTTTTSFSAHTPRGCKRDLLKRGTAVVWGGEVCGNVVCGCFFFCLFGGKKEIKKEIEK